MNEHKFFKELKKVNYRWQINKDGVIRLSPSCDSHSPITAICSERKGEVYMPEDWKEAASSMRLSIKLGQRITEASENVPGHDPALRQKILSITGLDQN